MKLKKFSKKELKNDFYPLFLNLMQKGYEIEACLLMLATWNGGHFRFVGTRFELYKFRKSFEKLEPVFKKFEKLDFRTINFDKYEYEREIKKIFTILCSFDGIKKTGASKLMHLKIPQVFVMWDKYIRNDKKYGFRNGDADDYFNFLKEMQRRFSKTKIPHGYRYTLPKLIDEHNYKTITEPIIRKNKKDRLNKKSKKL